MRTSISSKIIDAAIIAVIVDLTDQILERIGFDEEKSRVIRAIIKASVSALSGILIDAARPESEMAPVQEPLVIDT